MSARAWSAADVPDLGGRTALVTGGTTRLGEQIALELARHGAEVLLAASDAAALEAAVQRVTAAVPQARVAPLALEVSDLSSVRRAAGQVTRPLHLLVHAASAGPAPRERTADGLEPQLATRHHGPFALTGLLLDQLAASGAGRVVGVASPSGRVARATPLEDPRDRSLRHPRWRWHAAASLAHLMGVLELDERCRAHGVPVAALAARPGLAPGRDQRAEAGEGSTQRLRRTSAILHAARGLATQPAAAAALPVLMAATAELPGSSYVGPGGPLALRGAPAVVALPALARDREARRELWALSEEVTDMEVLR